MVSASWYRDRQVRALPARLRIDSVGLLSLRACPTASSRPLAASDSPSSVRTLLSSRSSRGDASLWADGEDGLRFRFVQKRQCFLSFSEKEGKRTTSLATIWPSLTPSDFRCEH